jgi:predicted small metal-binding protein
MEKVLRCGDVVPGCAAEVRAGTEEEVLRQAAEHARQAHGLEHVDKATLDRARAAIRTQS